MDADSPRLRMSILGIVIVALFGTLFARLWYLQVMTSSEFQEVAVSNTERLMYEEAPRGRILDREGRVLVDNRTSLIIAMNPTELDDAGRTDEILLRVAKELTSGGRPTKVAALERRMNDPQYNPAEPVPVAIDVPEELQVVVAEHPDQFPGVTVRREAVRAYPYGPVASHVVGYVGRINADELEAKQGTEDEPIDNPKPYQPDADIGKAGVEKIMEGDLRGTPGVRRVEVDSKGKVIRDVEYSPPIPGNDVMLTLDLDIQMNAELALGEQLELVSGQYTSSGYAQGRAGSVVALDPGSGGVMALASFPTYDPSEFVNGISTERYDELTANPADNPFVNRAISGLYAPGSTFKLVTAYGALKAGLPEARETYVDGGVYVLSGCTGNCERQNAGRQPHGPVDLPLALQVSSDVFFYHLGDLFYANAETYGDGIQSAARDFGFGALSGIDLPGEVDGVVPDADWKRTLFDSLPPDQQALGDPTWYPGDTVNLAIGQGDMLATPLQMTNSFATFVERGEQHRPFVVWKVLAPGGTLVGEEPADEATTSGTTPGTTPARVDTPGETSSTTMPSSTTTVTILPDGSLVTEEDLDLEARTEDGPRLDLSTAEVIREVEPEVNYDLDIPAELYDPIHDGLLGVTRTGYVHRGTAYDAFAGFDTEEFPLIAKTGTAQKNARTDTALFVACGPDPEAEICVGAVLEEAGFGGLVAAPMVRRILEPVAGQVTPQGQRPTLAVGAQED